MFDRASRFSTDRSATEGSQACPGYQVMRRRYFRMEVAFFSTGTLN
jgi:hypothetical protein